MRKPILGETLFSVNVGNNLRRGQEQVSTPVKVTKVGRKYFYCEEEGYRFESKFNIDDWKQSTNYIATAVLYDSDQHWRDENEANRIHNEIKNNFFSIYCNVGREMLPKLKKVLEILEED